MFPLAWWLIWIVVFVCPTSEHWIKNKWRYVLLGAFGALFGFIAIAAVTIDVYMVLWLVFFKLFITAGEWLFAYMNIYGLPEFKEQAMYEKSERGNIRLMFRRGNAKGVYRWLTAAAVLAIIVFSAVFLWQTQAVSGVNNATSFNQMLTFEPAGTPFFQHEIPNNMLRLTTEELARADPRCTRRRSRQRLRPAARARGVEDPDSLAARVGRQADVHAGDGREPRGTLRRSRLHGAHLPGRRAFAAPDRARSERRGGAVAGLRQRRVRRSRRLVAATLTHRLVCRT